MSYAVFESVNMASTRGAARIFDAVCATDVQNGTIGYISFAAKNNGFYTFTAGVKEGETIVIVDQPAFDAECSRLAKNHRSNFIVKANTPFTVRELKKNDVIGISDYSIKDNSGLAVEHFVKVADEDGTMTYSAVTTPDAKVEFTVEGVRMSGGAIAGKKGMVGKQVKIVELRLTKI